MTEPTTATDDAPGFFTIGDGTEIPRGGTDADWDRFSDSARILMSGVPTEYLEMYFQILVDELGEIEMSIEQQREEVDSK